MANQEEEIKLQNTTQQIMPYRLNILARIHRCMHSYIVHANKHK